MITGTLTLNEVTCASCATHFAIDRRLEQSLRESNETFYCPNGHSQWYGENQIDKLKKEKQSLEQSLRWAEIEARNAKQEKANIKRKLTITNKRIANGVCPCCNWTFKQLNRHMDSKHPDFPDFKKAVN